MRNRKKENPIMGNRRKENPIRENQRTKNPIRGDEGVGRTMGLEAERVGGK